MDASARFENILAKVQTSNLNFKLEISPFSAIICLKKSFAKDKYGQVLKPNLDDTTNQTNITTLLQKNRELENSYQHLKYDYQNALVACEETCQVNRDLKSELDYYKSLVKKETTEDVSDFETVKNEFKYLEKELTYKNKEIQEILEQNKNYKAEVKSVNAKHEKVSSEMKSFKEEKEILETKNKNLSSFPKIFQTGIKRSF